MRAITKGSVPACGRAYVFRAAIAVVIHTLAARGTLARARRIVGTIVQRAAGVGFLLRIGGFIVLKAERNTQFTITQLVLIDIAERAAIAEILRALLRSDIEIERVVIKLHLALDPAFAVIDRAHCFQNDLSSNTTFDQAGGLGLVDTDLVEQFGRKLAEVDRTVATAVGCQSAINRRRAEERAEAANGDFRSAALFDVRCRAGQCFECFTDGKRGQITDFIGSQCVKDLDRFALRRNRILNGLANARDDYRIGRLRTILQVRLAPLPAWQGPAGPHRSAIVMRGGLAESSWRRMSSEISSLWCTFRASLDLMNGRPIYVNQRQ